MALDKTTPVTINRRVRPIRFAFLVDPSSQRQLVKAVQLNTVLWGGRFNPLIPIYRRTPPSWGHRPFRAPRAKEIVEGYLKAFDPDVVVNVTPRPIVLPGFEETHYAERRLLRFSDLFDPQNREAPLRYGLDVLDLYRHLYAEEFRFQRRDALQVVLPSVSDRRMRPFLGACCGTFPTQPEYFRSLYSDAFKPTAFAIEPTNLLGLLTSRRGHPLRMGSAFLRSDHGRMTGSDPTLFFLDARNNLDLIDYWNLRATGWRVLPVPRQWASKMLEGCRKEIARAYQPYRHNPQMMHHATLLKARSVAEAEVNEFRRSLRLENAGMLVTQHWYPRIWDDWARDKDFVNPVEIYADDENIELQVSGERLVFKDKKPKFADDFGRHGNARWANVVTVKTYAASAEHAEVIPTGLPDIGRALGAIGLSPVRAGREGLVVPCQHRESSHHWELPSSVKVFETWATQQGYSFGLSSAGLVARQLLRQIDGVYGAWAFGNVDVLRLLERMSRGTVIPVGEMVNRLAATGDAARGANRRLDYLVQVKGLRVGVELQCEHCQQRTWYPLHGVRESLQCEKCLNHFEFPAASPPRDPWHYKTAGAFSVPDYCHGGYCVALALRLLTKTLHASTTAIPSFILEASGKSKLEADFGIVYRSETWFDREPYLLFGECKTFDRFVAKDVKRLRTIGRRFPGSILVFCTLNEQLNRTEKRLLRPLALAGRRYLRGEVAQSSSHPHTRRTASRVSAYVFLA